MSIIIYILFFSKQKIFNCKKYEINNGRRVIQTINKLILYMFGFFELKFAFLGQFHCRLNLDFKVAKE
jgi:hypothetical protein